MHVHVELLGPLVLPEPALDGPVELSPGATVAHLLEQVGLARAQLRFFRVAVGGEMVTQSTVLRDGDEVTIMLPMGGG